MSCYHSIHMFFVVFEMEFLSVHTYIYCCLSDKLIISHYTCSLLSLRWIYFQSIHMYFVVFEMDLLCQSIHTFLSSLRCICFSVNNTFFVVFDMGLLSVNTHIRWFLLDEFVIIQFTCSLLSLRWKSYQSIHIYIVVFRIN